MGYFIFIYINFLLFINFVILPFSWECYDTVQDIDKLLKALAKQGVRESALKACISNQYKHITNIITKK